MDNTIHARRLGLFLFTTLLAAGCGPADDESIVGSSEPGVDTSTQAVNHRPACGTRARTDAEVAADTQAVNAFKARGGSKKGDLTTITTYVHVIHDGDEGLLSANVIQDQISVLNAAYAAHGFRFELAASTASNPNPDYTDNAAWFDDDELAYKTALKEGTGEDLNLYTNGGGGYLGYAYYPSIVGTSSEILDGVVLAYGTLPGAFQPGISDIPGFVYNLGDTGTHEIGHYLGLAHTFEGGCSTKNDLVSDTPSEKSPDFYCTEGRNSCKDGSGPIQYDPIHNFMDYSDDVCLFEFTAGQTERMSDQWAIYREGN